MNFSFEDLKSYFFTYKIEIFFIVVALMLAAGSFVIFLSPQKAESKPIAAIKPAFQESPDKIFIDVSGAVNQPGLYKLNNGSRLKEAIDAAGGLKKEADENYFQRNFNLARVLADQDKIYIPSVAEIQNGIFREDERILNYLSPVSQQGSTTTIFSAQSSGKININTASEQELDSLSGVGPVTAQKIIEGRPYKTVDELLTRKILKSNVFNQIKDQLSVD